jgi:pyridoxine/pyridoxamine 5'-phosphate oxidase
MTLTGNAALVNPEFELPPSNPLLLFQKWLEIAEKVGVCEPRVLTLSSIDIANRTSSRVLLLKECDETGIVFGASQESTRGKTSVLIKSYKKTCKP